MKVKDLTKTTLFNAANLNSTYNSDDWYLFVKNRIATLLYALHGNRELLPTISDDADPDTTAQEEVDIVLYMNAYKYRHLWKLYTAEYNPLWNVDGTETTTTSRTENLSKDYTDKHTGDDTTNLSGTDDTTQTGSIKDENGGNIQDGRTTFDSSVALDTNKTVDTTTKTTTFNSKKDSTTWGRQDKLTFNSTHTIDDDSNNTINETVTHVRGGNIGVTKTTELETDELAFVNSFKFIEGIVADIANFISYPFM